MSTGKQQLIDQCRKQDKMHRATIQRTINANTQGTIFNSLVYNKGTITRSYQYEVSVSTLVYFFSLDQNWVLNTVITSYALLYITQLSNHNMGMSELHISITS